jgi:hypothetical protein
MRVAAIAVLAVASVSCGGGNAEVAPPETMTVAPDAGCADLARVRPMCLRAG